MRFFFGLATVAVPTCNMHVPRYLHEYTVFLVIITQVTKTPFTCPPNTSLLLALPLYTHPGTYTQPAATYRTLVLVALSYTHPHPVVSPHRLLAAQHVSSRIVLAYCCYLWRTA